MKLKLAVVFFLALAGVAVADQQFAVQTPQFTAAVLSLLFGGTGMSLNNGVINSNAVQHSSFEPGLLAAATTGKAGFAKFSKASTVDNLEGSALTFTCSGNPTVTFYECGTSATCASPVTIGSVTVSAANTVVDGTISATQIAAGDYVAWAISAGTCTALDIAATAQIHSN